jgi:hypothetical protein
MDMKLHELRISLLQDLYHEISPAADTRHIILDVVNKYQSNVDWENILHKIKNKYNLEKNINALDIWIQLIHTSGYKLEQPRQGGRGEFYGGDQIMVTPTYNRPDFIPYSGIGNVVGKGLPKSESSNSTEQKVSKKKVSTKKKVSPRKVSQIKYNEEYNLNDPPRYIPEMSIPKYIKPSLNIHIYSSLSNKNTNINALFDIHDNYKYSIINKELGNYLELIDKNNYPRMLKKINIRYDSSGLPIIPNILLVIDDIEITIDAVIYDTGKHDIILKQNDINTLRDMNIFISE